MLNQAHGEKVNTTVELGFLNSVVVLRKRKNRIFRADNICIRIQ